MIEVIFPNLHNAYISGSIHAIHVFFAILYSVAFPLVGGSGRSPIPAANAEFQLGSSAVNNQVPA